MPFYFLATTKELIPIKSDKLSFLENLLKRNIQDSKTVAYILFDEPRHPLEMEIMRLFEEIDGNSENSHHLEKITCSDALFVDGCLTNSEIRGIVFERRGNDFIIRGIMCANYDEYDSIFVNILCGVGGAGFLLKKLKEMNDFIYLESIALPNTQSFYAKHGFKAEKWFIDELIKKLEKIKDSNPKSLKDLYMFLDVTPRLYWVNKNDDSFLSEESVENVIKRYFPKLI